MESGDKLGRYEILEPLGAGGMGEVYRARDPRLEREVAIKLLPPEFAEDGERLARFEREAKAIAAIDHPSIVTIHSVEQDGGVHFLTTQLIEGKTLDQVLPQEGLPLDRFFELAIPLADAVAAAHERGIAHRDLKPANVMVTAEDRVKVVDFGLAKLAEPADEDETLSRAGTALAGTPQAALTEEGKVLGTVAYMSPEQAEGKSIDHRTDIFSLGVILYEMATGARPFDGDTKMSVLSAILRTPHEPVTRRNPRLPRHLGRIINHALEKNPERRFQSAKDIRIELEGLRDEIRSGELEPISGEQVRTGEVARPARFGALPALGVAVAAILGLVTGYALWGTAPAPPPAPEAWVTEQLTHLAGVETDPAISRDGQTVVYAGDATGNFDIYTQRVGGGRAFNLTAGSSAHDRQPAFSPDGERIAFRSERDGGGLFVMGATGEQVAKLTDDGYQPAFSPAGDRIVASTYALTDPLNVADGDLFVVDVETGEIEVLISGLAYQPQWSPDGRFIAYTGVQGGQRDIWTLPAEGGDPVRVTDSPTLDWNPVWAVDGRSLYLASDRGGSGSGIWRVAIDPGTGAADGNPEQITTSESLQGFLGVAGDATGDIVVYASDRQRSNIQRVAFDPETRTLAGEPEWVTRGSRVLWSVDVAPDGQQLVLATKTPVENLYTLRLDTGEENQITDDPFRLRRPRWSATGGEVFFYGNRDGGYEIWSVPPSGGSQTKVIAAANGERLMDPVWSPDGSRMVYHVNDRGSLVADADAIGESAQELPAPDYEGASTGFRAHSWTPDGSRLAGNVHVRNDRMTAFAVYSFDDGGYEFFEVDGYTESARWLDNRYVLAIAGENNRAIHRLVVVDTATGDVTELMNIAPDVFEIDIDVSQDRRWIYYPRMQSEADLYLLRRVE